MHPVRKVWAGVQVQECVSGPPRSMLSCLGIATRHPIFADFFFNDRPRGGGHHTTGSSGSPTEHEVESPQHQRGPMYELPRPRHSPSVSPRTTELPLTLAPPPKRLKYDPAHPSETGTGHHGGQSLPSWRQQMDHQQAYSRAGQLPPLPRLHHDESRWRSESYPPGFHSANDVLGGRPQAPPRLPRLPDARV